MTSFTVMILRLFVKMIIKSSFALSVPMCVWFADTPVCYHVDGSRQALRVTLYLDSCHFSELPSRLQNGGSLKLHTVLFTKGKAGREFRGKESGSGEVSGWGGLFNALKQRELWFFWHVTPTIFPLKTFNFLGKMTHLSWHCSAAEVTYVSLLSLPDAASPPFFIDISLLLNVLSFSWIEALWGQ